MTPDPAVTALEALLEEERQALLAGDIGRFATLADRKEALAGRLQGQDADPATLAALRSRLERNAALLDAALAGIRSVADRLAAMREVREALATYDPRGQRRNIRQAAAPRLEKRS